LEEEDNAQTPPVFLRDEAIDLTTHLAMLRNCRSPALDKQKLQGSMKSEKHDTNSTSAGGRFTPSGATTARSENDAENDSDDHDDDDTFDFAIGFVRLDDPVPIRRDSTISLDLSARSVDEEHGACSGAPGISTRSDADLIFGDIEL
jgi:hypothetical protein